ncbi:MAG: glutamate--tRNA ligase [Pseudomonadota bacterium]
MTTIVRFAPSPTGKLHVGNIRAALLNWLFAKNVGGQFMWRSDDTDGERSTKDFEDGIGRDLAWLGLTHDLFARQSERFDKYDAARDKLIVMGLLYPCYETPEELDRKRKLQRARSLPPVYDRAALDLTNEEKAAFEAEGRKPHWRFKLSQQPVTWTDLIRGDTTVDTASVSDPVLIREDGGYLYTLPSVVDDIEFAITHIIRGEDHVTNTATQVEIFKALGGQAPQFAHHSLLVGADGEGLSKRLGSLSIEAFREDGLEPEAITSLLAKLGTSDAVEPERDLAKLASDFDFSKMGRAPARFDPAELTALNAKILHDTPYGAVADRLSALGASEALWEIVKGNVEKLADVTLWKNIAEGEITPVIEDAEFATAAAALLPSDPLTEDSWSAWTSAVKEKTGAKGKQLFLPLRLALTGQKFGPEMNRLLPLIGAERAKARLAGETA